jgi:serine/threonine protein kinase
MHMISSYPNHSTASRRVKPQHRAAMTTYHVAGSAMHGTTSKVAAASRQAFQSRYQTYELVGRGGMSEVYRGFDAQLGRPVAIKRLRPDLVINPVFRSRFRREAQAAGKLSHSAIVAVYDTGEDRDATGSTIPFIVMELVEGRSLRDVLREEGKVSSLRALELTARVLDALACSHGAGIIHRDIKPGNVMLTNTGGVKVADFGIARAVSDSSGTATMSGAVMGTAQYLAPEQARGETADVRSDIYSVGCLLYELLVGRPPFTGDSMVSIVFQHISDLPSPPSAANPDVSTDIDAITLKALAKEPADRYQTALEMKADVESVLSGQSPAATTLLPASMIELPEGQRSKADRSSRQQAVRLTVILSAFLLTVIGASIFGISRASRPQAAGLRTTEVPAVLGLSQVGAESLLRNAHLVPRFEFIHDADGASVDTAIRQSPEGGNPATIGSNVIVTINSGPRKATVPRNLIGRDVDQVIKVLQRAGFRNIKRQKVIPATAAVSAGEVMSMAPAAGRAIPLVERITVTYAGQAAPRLVIRQPSVASGHKSQTAPRLLIRQPSVAFGHKSRSNADSGSSQQSQPAQSDGPAEGASDQGKGSKINRKSQEHGQEEPDEHESEGKAG